MRAEVHEIEAMDRDQLRALWSRILADPVPPRLSTPLMRRILAFEVQARRHGGLGAKTRRALAKAAAPDAAPRAPGLRPGARLMREWYGVTHVVDVTDDGYRWNGTRYRSLSAIAREITGARWSGPRFFGLTASGGAR